MDDRADGAADRDGPEGATDRDGALSRRDALKSLPLAAGVPGLLSGRAGADGISSTEPPENPPAMANSTGTLSLSGTAADADGRSFLVVKDCSAWYSLANEVALSNLGYAYDVVTSSEFGGQDLGGYTDVVLVSTQTDGYYDRLDANSDALEGFVADGGTLHAHVATFGYPCTTRGTPAFLPGGVDTVVNLDDNLTIVDGNSPVVTNVDDVDGWNSSTHGYLTNLPDSASVVIGEAGNPTGRPTFVEYGYGDGTVLATTQTIEWPYYSDFGTTQLLLNDLQYRGGAGGVDVDQLVTDKRARIEQIRGLAGQTIGDGEADDTVDQVAADLVDDIEADAFDVSDEQYGEALNRLIATEDVTKASTEAATGSDSPMQSNIENLFSLLKGVAMELIGRLTGGILKNVVDSIIRGIVRKFDDLLRGLNGRGVIGEETMESITTRLDAGKQNLYEGFTDFAEENPQQAEEIVGTAEGAGLAEAQGAAEGLLAELDDGRSLVNTLEEFYFEGYYFAPDWPVLNVPTTDQIELPDLEFFYDVPDEELPDWAQGSVPDTISLDLESPDIDLPDGVDEVATALEEIQEVSSSGGIDTTVDERATRLEEDLGSLSEQDSETRDLLASALTTGISVSSEVTELLIDLLEGLQGLLSEFSELLTYLTIVAVVSAGVLLVTGIGTLGLLGIAGTLASASATVGVIALAIDGLQIGIGQGYLSLLTTIHQGGTLALAETDLGGVDL